MLEKLQRKIQRAWAAFLDTDPPIHQIPRFIHPDSLLVLTSRGWYIGKRRLQTDQASILKEEARQFADSFLWKLMRNDVHYQAYLQGTAKRRTDLDAVYAGAMYRDLEILEKFIDNCAAIKL